MFYAKRHKYMKLIKKRKEAQFLPDINDGVSLSIIL